MSALHTSKSWQIGEVIRGFRGTQICRNFLFDDAIKIHLGERNTKGLLNNFYPYILLRTMLGNKLNFPQKMNISISIPTINYPDFVKFQIDLETI